MKLTKSGLITHCQEIIQKRIQALEEDLRYLAEDIAEDTKSSAGDKYETSREMANLERQKLADQLRQNKKALNNLNNIKPASRNKVQAGALIETDAGFIFITISLGPVDYAGQKVLVISPNAPLAQALLGARPGDQVDFHQQHYRLISVC